MTTLAVLLIIGSATIGPIEAEFHDTLKPGESCVQGPGVNTCPGRYESLPELCERAMREAGLRLATSGMKPDGSSYGPMQWTTQRGLKTMTGAQYWKGSDGSEYYLNDVRCIPVPTGYRR